MVSGLACGTDYALGVTAVDAAGNESYRPEAVAQTSTMACDPSPTPTATPTATATATATPTATPTSTPTPPTGPADFYVSPSGNDSNACTQAAPCASFTRAYNVASSGQVVQVGAGVYQWQTIPAGTKAVTFRGVPGNKVRTLDINSDNVTVDGLDIDANMGTPNNHAVLETGASKNVTIKNSRVGGTTDQKGAVFGGTSARRR